MSVPGGMPGDRATQPGGSTGGPVEKPSARTLVIVPTYNERLNLPLIVERLQAAQPDVHLLIVDDGSPDGTGALADELAMADPDRVHVMHRTAKEGLGAAYLAGLQSGIFTSLDDIAQQWQCQAEFPPKWDDEQRQKHQNLWHESVEKVLTK